MIIMIFYMFCAKMCFKAVKGIGVFNLTSSFMSLEGKMSLECLGIFQGEMYYVSVK